MPKAYTPNDKFFYRAKEQGYRARSAFKLIEIDDKFGIFEEGKSVLDLGACPGSWCQVAKQRVGADSTIIGVDLKQVKKIKNVKTLICDVFTDELGKVLFEHGHRHFDVVMSDMAPNTSGIPDVDQYRSVELNLKALDVMKKHLKTGGWGIFKIFKGADFNDFWFEALKTFPRMKTFKPKAVRDRSVETYCIGKKAY